MLHVSCCTFVLLLTELPRKVFHSNTKLGTKSAPKSPCNILSLQVVQLSKISGICKRGRQIVFGDNGRKCTKCYDRKARIAFKTSKCCIR